MLSWFSCVCLFLTPWQDTLAMGISRQEYWSGLPFPPSGDLPDPQIEPESLMSPALAGRLFTTSATWEAPEYWSRSPFHSKGLFPTQASNLCLLPVSLALAAGFFTPWAMWELWILSSYFIPSPSTSLLAQMVKNLLATRETWLWSLGWKDSLEQGMATHLSVLIWRIPWTKELGGLQSMELQRVGHDRAEHIPFFFSNHKLFSMSVNLSLCI